MPARALVVDDDASSCEFIKEVLLHATGGEVLALTDSHEAAAWLAEEKFGIILLDLQMPAPDGTELARHVRRGGLNQMTPIIMLSDDQSTGAVSNGFAAGAQFFIYKPIDKTKLLHLIRATHGAVQQEKRRFRRIPLHTRVRLQFEKVECEGETVDVSFSGMLVKVPMAVPVSAAVRVILYTPESGMPITGSGSVVRSAGGGRLGIQLHRLAPSESSRLQEFLLPLILQDERSDELHAQAGHRQGIGTNFF